MTKEIKQVSRKNLKFTTSEIELGSNGDNAKTSPVKLIALSGKPFDAPFWGRCIQDLSGMTLTKKRIAIDLEHDKPIGYINKFDVIDNQLILSGAITPVTEDAKDTLALMQAGVPFESSIDFSPSHSDDLIIDYYDSGLVPVNGQTFEAPLTVFRKWVLRAVAICKSGADDMTLATLQSKQDAHDAETINVTINKQDKQDSNMTMEETDNTKQTVQDVIEAVKEEIKDIKEDTAKVIEAVKETVSEIMGDKQEDKQEVKEVKEVKEETPVIPVTEPVIAPEAQITAPEAPTIEQNDKGQDNIGEAVQQDLKQDLKPVEVTAPATVPEGINAEVKTEVKPHEMFKQFVSKFGTDKATEYFQMGITFEDAKEKHYEYLQAEKLANIEIINKQNGEIEKLKEGLKAKVIRPVEFEQSTVSVKANLWEQYKQLKDAKEKTMFYRLHKKEMDK